MFNVPPMPALDELHMDAMALQTLINSELLNETQKETLTRELQGLQNSITFIHNLGG